MRGKMKREVLLTMVLFVLGFAKNAWAIPIPEIPETPSFLAPFLMLGVIGFAYWVRSLLKK